WIFMREKNLKNAVRCSLENFGAFDYEDKEAGGVLRHVQICPLYAISQMDALIKEHNGAVTNIFSQHNIK
ncbi:MAG: hypothetical protein IKN78_07315, partial [Bacteroidales bacterium]|nr:hypothetical protein [Bacteroidales bacterium]